VLLLARLHEPARPAAARRGLGDDLRQGAGFVLGHALLRPILLTAVLFNTAFFVLQAAFVPYAVERLGLGAAAVGGTLASYGVGMVLGALLAPYVARRLRFGAVIAVGPVAGFAGALLMLLTLWLPSPLLAGLGFFLLGAGPVIWVISTTTLRQVVTPNELLGRASAMIGTATHGARPIGAALGGLVGGICGLEWAIALAALGFLLQAAVILASPAVRLGALPAQAGAVAR